MVGGMGIYIRIFKQVYQMSVVSNRDSIANKGHVFKNR